MNQISPLAYIHPEAQLGDNNVIGPFCYIDRNTVIGNGNVLQNSVTINYGARIGNGNEFFAGGSISAKPQDLKFKGEDSICQIGDNNSFRENVNISRGTASKGTTQIGNNCLLMENVHVAHDCFLGNNLIIGNSTKLAGEVIVDDNAIISAAVLCHQFCRIAGFVMIQGGSRFSLDIPPYIIAGREPTRYCGINIIGLRRRGYSAETIDLIHNAYRLLYSKTVRQEGIDAIKQELPISKEVEYIIQFVQSSQRGIIR
ncbi:MAG: acyl-ACP--UDP-N-acetylglucosamine O-acyltransferase [Prevotella sp.]|nr:acyl-ACP--UDP-N-acetylglucosamine O-acyltransferase [Prevotella sp.]